MDNILKLIKEEDVKWVKLGEVSQFINGYAFKANLFREKGSPIIKITNIQNGAINFNDCKYINLNDYKNLENFLIKKGDILIAMSGATVGKIGYNFKEKEAYLNQRVGKIVPNENILNNKYLYYYLMFKEKTIANLTNSTGAQPNLNKSDIEKLMIPIPNLETQRKIVDILDRYTKSYEELKECLAKEKDLRIKQYEYYRDKLLSEEYLIKKTKELCGEDAKVEVKTLNEIGIVTKLAGYEFTEYVKYSDEGNIIALRGLNVKKGSLVLEDVKYIDNSKLEKLNRSKLYIDDILYTYVGTVGEVALIDKNDKYYLAPNVALIRINDKNSVLSKYILYYLQSNSFKYNQLNKLLSVSSMKNLTMEKIRLFKIPIPPLKVQEHIVDILDKFDKLTNDIKEGLPKEIELRTKQYEYYREKLLDFKK